MAAQVSAVVEPLSENGLTFQIHMGYTKNAMDTAVTHAELEHILRTMLQIVDNAYYRAGYLTVEHDMLGIMKRMLETGIGALQQTVDDECAVIEVIESVETHAND
jgi:hypothetical protein